MTSGSVNGKFTSSDREKMDLTEILQTINHHGGQKSVEREKNTVDLFIRCSSEILHSLQSWPLTCGSWQTTGRLHQHWYQQFATDWLHSKIKMPLSQSVTFPCFKKTKLNLLHGRVWQIEMCWMNNFYPCLSWWLTKIRASGTTGITQVWLLLCARSNICT